MISEKIRSLHRGMQAGMAIQMVKDMECIALRDLPYELEDIVVRWLLAVPADIRPEFLLTNTHITLPGWSAFVSWMTRTLVEAQLKDGFETSIRDQLMHREVMAVAPVGCEFGSPDYERLAATDTKKWSQDQ